jgi:hypothetical protein
MHSRKKKKINKHETAISEKLFINIYTLFLNCANNVSEMLFHCRLHSKETSNIKAWWSEEKKVK